MRKSKYNANAMSGCLEPPESPEYKRWLASLPPFLLEIMSEELAVREAAAQKKFNSIEKREG